MANQQSEGQGMKRLFDKYLPSITILIAIDLKSKEKQNALPLKNLEEMTKEGRAFAYSKAIEQLDLLDIEHLSIMTLEFNPGCLEKGLDVVQKYIITKWPLLYTRALKDITRNLLEKSYLNLKMRSKINSIFAHIFNNGQQFIIFDTINSSLANQNPKIVQGSISLILELLQQFGAKKMENLAPFFKQINKLMEGQSDVLKNDVVFFYKEAVKQLGSNFLQYWKNLSDKLKQELNEIVQELPNDDNAIKAIGSEIIIGAPLIDLDEMVQYNTLQYEKNYKQQKQQYEDEEQAQINYAMIYKQKQPQPMIYFNQNHQINMQESKILSSQEKLQQFDKQQEKEQLQIDFPKKRLEIFGKGQNEIQHIEQKAKLQTQVALQEKEYLSPQLEQQQSRVIQSKFALANYSPSISSQLIDNISSQKQKSADNINTLEQAQSSKKKNQETTQNAQYIFEGGNPFEQKPFIQEVELNNDDIGQGSGYKNFKESKNRKMSYSKQDLEKERQKSKQIRLGQQDNSGFIYYYFSEQQWNQLKEQIIEIELPQNLIDKMFCKNAEQHIQGMIIIKSQILNIPSISDLLFKWGYMISFMETSIQLQQNVQMLFMDLTNKLKKQNQKLTNMEASLFYVQQQMVCILLTLQVLSESLIPIIMTNQLEVKRMGFEATEFYYQFPVSNQVHFLASIIYKYIGKYINQYEDISEQNNIVANIIYKIKRLLPFAPSKQEIFQSDPLFRYDNTLKEERQFAEFLDNCDLIVKDRFIYSYHYKLVAFLKLTFNVGSFNLSNAQIKIFLTNIHIIIDSQNFIHNFRYDDFLSLFNFLIQRIAILNEATVRQDDIIFQYSSVLIKLVNQIDIHFIYKALLDILSQTRNDGILVCYKYVSQMFAKFSNKLIEFLYNEYEPTKFAEILIKISEYIKLCQKYIDLEFNKIDELNFKTLKIPFNSLMSFSDIQEIEHIFHKTEPNSLLREWYEEYKKTSDQQKQPNSTFRLLSDNLRLKFAKIFENLIIYLQQFYDQNWQQHVNFLNPDQIKSIECKVKQGQR